MPFAYAVYWGIHAIVVLWLSQLVAKRFGFSMLKSMLVLAIPVNYAWDFLVEGVATAMGWWTYDPGMGPVLEWSNGGRITLVWTIGLMCVWPNLIAYWAGKPPIRGLNHFERFFRLERFTRPKPFGALPSPVIPAGAGASPATAILKMTKQQEFDAHLNYDVIIPRWKFELRRLLAWAISFQVTFFVFLIVPLVTLRWITGADSVHVP